MSLITKELIWAELQTLEIVLLLIDKHKLPLSNPFVVDFLNYKAKIEKDLVELK